jgi:L-amino acid N-acyltransferase YncA
MTTERRVRVADIAGERGAPQLLPFPASIMVADEELVLRRLQAGDGDAIVQLARRLEQHDLLFLRRDITDRAEVEEWIADALAGHTPTILAFAGDRLVGYVLLAAERVSWARHLAEVRVLIAPEWRGRQLGGLLVSQAVALAQASGYIKLIVQMTYEQDEAHAAFTHLGFAQEASLPDRVIDREGQLRALRVLGLKVAAFEAPATALTEAARSLNERTVRWNGIADLLDPNGVVVAEVAAWLWKLSRDGRGTRWGGELTAPAGLGLRWAGEAPPRELRVSGGGSAPVGSLGAVRMETVGGEAMQVVQLTGQGEPPF